MYWCHFTKLNTKNTISWDYLFKKQSERIFEKKYKNLFFNIEYSQSQLSFIFLKNFHRDNSIYKILTTPSYGGVKEEIYRRMPCNFFSVVPIPAKAKKLGLLSIYKFSLIRPQVPVSATLLLSALSFLTNENGRHTVHCTASFHFHGYLVCWTVFSFGKVLHILGWILNRSQCSIEAWLDIDIGNIR